jgi:hypothetical protein
VNDAAAVMAEAVELAVTVLEREGDGTFCGYAAVADFGNVELLACNQPIDVSHGVPPARVTYRQR